MLGSGPSLLQRHNRVYDSSLTSKLKQSQQPHTDKTKSAKRVYGNHISSSLQPQAFLNDARAIYPGLDDHLQQVYCIPVYRGQSWSTQDLQMPTEGLAVIASAYGESLEA